MANGLLNDILTIGGQFPQNQVGAPKTSGVAPLVNKLNFVQSLGVGSSPQAPVNSGGGGNTPSVPTYTTNTGQQLNQNDWQNSSEYKLQQMLADQQAAYQREGDAAYNQSNDYLNQAEGAVKADFPNALAAAQSNYDTNASQLGNSRQNAFDTLGQQQAKGQTGYENALAESRRIFQEQQQGSQQRFGGTSSAGQAVSEIQGREQARQFGQTNRQFTDLVNQINTQHASVDRDYETGLLQLSQQKQASIQQATQDFNNKLLQISNNRAQLSQAKADQSLQALQGLRNQVFAIEQQNTQFQQQLALQKQQAQLALGNYSQQVMGATNNAQSAVQNTQYGLPSNQTAATGGLSQGTGQQMALQGATTNTTGKRWDPYTGQYV